MSNDVRQWETPGVIVRGPVGKIREDEMKSLSRDGSLPVTAKRLQNAGFDGCVRSDGTSCAHAAAIYIHPGFQTVYCGKRGRQILEDEALACKERP
ncbi:MAG: hypothetical protein AAB709_01715 [Patescibacteria group bacterium]